MLINEQAIEEVTHYCDRIDASASSHWRLDGNDRGAHPLKENPFSFTFGREGFAAVGPIGAISTKRGPAYRLAHRMLQVPIRAIGRGFPTFASIDRTAATIAERQGRVYDKDLLRHVLTLAFLRRHLDLESETDPIAVIGDGFANMTALILGCLPYSRVILVNLTKVLLVDMAFAFKALPGAGMVLVRDAGEMDEAMRRTDLRVLAVGADSARLLADVPIALGINILSMMEIDPPVTRAYFDILRQCPRARTAFYCCNRIEKRLPDGTVTRFFDYPWDPRDEILVDEPSPWDRYGYHGKPPFYYRNNPTQHRLVWLNKDIPRGGAR